MCCGRSCTRPSPCRGGGWRTWGGTEPVPRYPGPSRHPRSPRSQAPLGNAVFQALLGVHRATGSRASGTGFPSRAWEPDGYQKSCMGRGITVMHIYGSELKYLSIALPPISEQAAIVRHLDHVDRRVRRLLRAKRKLITLLTEQKQAIIHRAVTRGLDPDVPLKDSGVEWLGQVPAHWERVSVGRLATFVTSGSRGWAEFYSDSGSVFIQSGNLGRDLSLDLSSVQHVSPPDRAEGQRTKVRKHDVLICITGALTGNVVLVEADLDSAFVNQHVALVRPRDVVPKFLAYALRSEHDDWPPGPRRRPRPRTHWSPSSAWGPGTGSSASREAELPEPHSQAELGNEGNEGNERGERGGRERALAGRRRRRDDPTALRRVPRRAGA